MVLQVFTYKIDINAITFLTGFLHFLQAIGYDFDYDEYHRYSLFFIFVPSSLSNLLISRIEYDF